jgi:hypothetical protein
MIIININIFATRFSDRRNINMENIGDLRSGALAGQETSEIEVDFKMYSSV